MSKSTFGTVNLALLKGRIEYLNSMTNNEDSEYPNQKYVLCQAYGGYKLEIMDDKHCIVKSITGRHTKKELYYLINSYIDGMWDSDRLNG